MSGLNDQWEDLAAMQRDQWEASRPQARSTIIEIVDVPELRSVALKLIDRTRTEGQFQACLDIVLSIYEQLTRAEDATDEEADAIALAGVDAIGQLLDSYELGS